MSEATRALLLAGRPGVGKTTAIRRAADRLSDLGARGFYTEEVRDEGGRRTGFRARPLARYAGSRDEERDLLIASVHLDGSPRVGRYGVDVDAVDAATRRYLSDDDADVLFVDEIGKMECYSDRFVARIRELLATDRPLVATVARRGGGLIAEVKDAPGAELHEVTEENRDRVPAAVEAWVRERMG